MTRRGAQPPAGPQGSPFPVVPPIFAGYVKWLLDRDPEYAVKLIQRWKKP